MYIRSFQKAEYRVILRIHMFSKYLPEKPQDKTDCSDNIFISPTLDQ